MIAPSPIRTLIVDDEPHARETIRGLLLGDSRFEIIGECGNGRDALRMIEGRKPHLLFLDIRMPGLDAFEMLARLDAPIVPVVVFVTAFDEYALKAFDVHALDYLLKPFDDERFLRVVERVLNHFSHSEDEALTMRLLSFLHGATRSGGSVYLRRVAIREIGRTLFVPLDEVDWIESEDYYVCLHVGAKSLLLRETMTKLAGRLDPLQFVRIHRSAIVNLDRVTQLKKSSLVLRTGVEIPVSRKRRGPVANALEALTRRPRQ